MTIRNPFGSYLKNLELTVKSENDCLKIKVGEDIISNDFDLTQRFNDYFIDVAANLKAPIEQSNFDDLRGHVRLKNPDNIAFSYQK